MKSFLITALARKRLKFSILVKKKELFQWYSLQKRYLKLLMSVHGIVFLRYFSTFLWLPIGKKALINTWIISNHLDLKGTEKRSHAVKIMHIFLKSVVELSNTNIIRNLDYLLFKSNSPAQNITWVDPAQKRLDGVKFELTYWNWHFWMRIQTRVDNLQLTCGFCYSTIYRHWTWTLWDLFARRHSL